MNCEFCGSEDAKKRCPSCGTSVCKKHTDSRIGDKIFGGLFLLIPSVLIVRTADSYLGVITEEWQFLVGILVVAGALAELFYGQACMKCKARLKDL